MKREIDDVLRDGGRVDLERIGEWMKGGFQ